MKKYIKAVLLIVFATVLSFAQAGKVQPNIIYINADDLGVMDVGFNAQLYHTPNIDQLRKEGMLFSEAYAPAANCAPSRAWVLSGQYGPRHGVYTVNSSERGKAQHRKLVPIKNTTVLAPGNATLADALQAAGYRTIHLGKWHVSKDPLKNGFDVNIGGGTQGHPTGGYYSSFKRGEMKAFSNRYPAGTHRVDIYADQAIRFMRETGDQPFFMHMAFYSVHTPLEEIPELVEKYKSKPIHAVYASMVEKMDQGIGKILAELDALGLREKTLVLFCSDNGGISQCTSQAPYRSFKGSYFEGGVRVPLVIRWPGKVPPNSICKTPVIGVDFFPTFLEAAMAPVPANKVLDGCSLIPLLTGTGTFPERTLFWHFPIYLQGGPENEAHDVLFRTRPGSTLRQGKWKLHEYFEDGRIELYDLEADTGERQNVASQYPEKAAELRSLLSAWRKAMKAPVPTQLNRAYNAEQEAEAIRKLGGEK
ncbi:sulfatase [Pontiella agarivorans]|uniref:Sulfatase n=1 Tax=Pontiella agarivorans TaxID=3038953 RepID=A0ABU5N0R8_9BACT|nr:sulfatase [Pontiella agarivorans]MDZ8120037.1 sulfatase [Pontiella agarivorans]